MRESFKMYYCDICGVRIADPVEDFWSGGVPVKYTMNNNSEQVQSTNLDLCPRCLSRVTVLTPGDKDRSYLFLKTKSVGEQELYLVSYQKAGGTADMVKELYTEWHGAIAQVMSLFTDKILAEVKNKEFGESRLANEIAYRQHRVDQTELENGGVRFEYKELVATVQPLVLKGGKAVL